MLASKAPIPSTMAANPRCASFVCPVCLGRSCTAVHVTFGSQQRVAWRCDGCCATYSDPAQWEPGADFDEGLAQPAG